MFKSVTLANLVLLSMVQFAAADDIDIYRHLSGTGTKVRRIMLALDLSSSNNSPACDNAAAADCQRRLGNRMLSALDIYGIAQLADHQLGVRPMPDGVADSQQYDPLDSRHTLAQNYWPQTVVTRQAMARAAISASLSVAGSAVAGLSPYTTIEVGVMLPHANNCAGAGPALLPDYALESPIICSQGAYVLQGFTDITDRAGMVLLAQRLAAIPEPGQLAPWMSHPWAGHGFRIRDIYLELHRYLRGLPVFNGFLGASDFGSQLPGNLYHNGTGRVHNDVLFAAAGERRNRPALAPDVAALVPDSLDVARNNVAGARYQRPEPDGVECVSTDLVNLVFGTPGRSDDAVDRALGASDRAGGLGVGTVSGGLAGDREIVATMAGTQTVGFSGIGTAASIDTDSVHSYFISDRSRPDLDALALSGGTGNALLFDSPARLLAALDSLFYSTPVRSVTLASPGIAGDGANSERSAVYYPLFQPRRGWFWPGNIKKLRLVPAAANDDGIATGIGTMVAQAPLSQPPVPALSAIDGEILPDALTFWTDPAGPDVMDFDPSLGQVLGRDGRAVTRGGAGQRVPGVIAGIVGAANTQPGARQLFTENPEAAGQLLPLAEAQADNEQLRAYLDPQGHLDVTDRGRLLRWLRGGDAFDEDRDGDRQESRPWLLGGVLHSSPLVIDYGVRPGRRYSAGNRERRVLFGGADGFLHMLEDTKEGLNPVESGRETWAFLPLESIPSLVARARGREQRRRFYGMDGSAVAYVNDRDGDGNIEVGDGDTVWVFVGQRRGGRALYAFDMSDPDNVRLKWKITPRTPGFDQLAMTFSTPRVARLDLGGGELAPVVIFAGGYNGGTTADGRLAKDAGDAPDTVGNSVYVVEADSGGLLWQAVGPTGADAPANSETRYYVDGLTDSIPSPVTVVDANGNGVADRAYVGDSGGKIWRIALTEARFSGAEVAVPAAQNWSMTLLADLGGAGSDDRRFFHAPDFVATADGQGNYHGIVIVSGNRAAPLDTAVSNFAYLLKDRYRPDIAPPAVITQDALADITDRCDTLARGECRLAQTGSGWRLALSATGEKGMSAPVTSNGVIAFSTYVPSSNAADSGCTVDLGHSRLYRLRLDSAAGANPLRQLDQLGQPSRYRELGPGISAGIVPTDAGLLLPGGGVAGRSVYRAPGREFWRVYWREEGIDTP